MMTAGTALPIPSLYQVLQRTLMKENGGNNYLQTLRIYGLQEINGASPYNYSVTVTKNKKC